MKIQKENKHNKDGKMLTDPKNIEQKKNMI